MKRLLASLTVPLLAACGASLASTTMTLTPSPAEEVFGCARGYAKAEGFWEHSVDEGDLRLVVRKVKEGVRTAEPLFRRAFDELTIEIDSEAADGTGVSVVARTWFEYMGRRGPTLEAKRASSEAEASAQALLSRCAPEAESAGG